MKTRQVIVAGAFVLCGAFSAVAVERHVVRSGKPAADDITGWERESYPIGNGWFGVNVFGGVECERLQVTENSVLTRRNLSNALDIRLRFKSAGGEISDCSRTLELEWRKGRRFWHEHALSIYSEAHTEGSDPF